LPQLVTGVCHKRDHVKEDERSTTSLELIVTKSRNTFVNTSRTKSRTTG